jgi:hypothetical protein
MCRQVFNVCHQSVARVLQGHAQPVSASHHQRVAVRSEGGIDKTEDKTEHDSTRPLQDAVRAACGPDQHGHHQ